MRSKYMKAGRFLVLPTKGNSFEVTAMSLDDAIYLAETKCCGPFKVEVIHVAVGYGDG